MRSPSSEYEVGSKMGAFCSALVQLEQEQVYQLGDLQGFISHTGAYSDRYKQLQLNEAGLYLTDEYLPLVKQLGGISVWFDEQRGLRLGKEDSHNDVRHGLFQVVGSSGLLEEQVAVKPQNPTNLIRTNVAEAAKLQYMKGLGLPTFDLVGVLAHGDEDYLLTKYNKQVMTLDAVDLLNMSEEERWSQLDLVVDTLVMLHAQGLFHGDLKLRNVGFGEQGKPIIVDPELMFSARDTLVRANEELAAHEVNGRALASVAANMAVEFNVVRESIEETIIPMIPKRFRPRTNEQKYRVLKTHIFKPYRELLQQTDTPYKSVLLAAFDQVHAAQKAGA